MTDQHMRTWGSCPPFPPEVRKILNPIGKVADMPGYSIAAQPAGTGLTAPIGSSYMPTLFGPIIKCFQIFLVEIPTAGHEQQRTAAIGVGRLPVNAADRRAIACAPDGFEGSRRDRTAIKIAYATRRAADR